MSAKDQPDLNLIREILSQLAAKPPKPLAPGPDDFPPRRPPLRVDGVKQADIERHLLIMEQADLFFFRPQNAPDERDWQWASITDGGRELLELLLAAHDTSRSKRDKDRAKKLAKHRLDWKTVFTYRSPPVRPERFMSVDHARNYFMSRCFAVGAKLHLNKKEVRQKWLECSVKLQPYPPNPGIAVPVGLPSRSFCLDGDVHPGEDFLWSQPPAQRPRPSIAIDIWNPMIILREDYLRVMVEEFEIRLGEAMEQGEQRLKDDGWRPRLDSRERGVDLDLRYDWAAKHLCFGIKFAAIAIDAARLTPADFPSSLSSEKPTAKDLQKGIDRIANAIETVKKDIDINWE